MAYKITKKCISCDLCIPECPTNAIKIVDGQRFIDRNLCTNCVGSIHNVPQCMAGCPTFRGCIKEPQDYWELWFDTYKQVRQKLTKQQDYWENWFNIYSQKYSEQLQNN